MQLTLDQTTHRLRQFYELTKPRVVSLIVFCAVIGMFLAGPSDGLPPLGLVTLILKTGLEWRYADELSHKRRP